jgi:hypothetical protein
MGGFVETPCYGEVVTDSDVITAVFEQAGLAVSLKAEHLLSVETEGHIVYFEFDAGRLTGIRVTVVRRM